MMRKGIGIAGVLVCLCSYSGGLSGEAVRNIAGRARIATNPPAFYSTARLTDGTADWGTALWEAGTRDGVEIDFHFDRPYTVVGTRFVQTRLLASGWRISADTTGDGKFDRLLVDRLVEPEPEPSKEELTRRKRANRRYRFNPYGKLEDTWIEDRFGPVRIRALRFKATRGPKTWRNAYPVLKEFQILAVGDVGEGPRKVRPQRALARVTELTRPVEDAPAGSALPRSERYVRGMYLCSFHLGNPALDVPMDRQPKFKEAVRRLKFMNVDAIILYAHGYSKEGKMLLLPSKVARGTKRNVFGEICRGMHRAGITVTASLGPNLMTPLQAEPKAWYPHGQSDRFKTQKPMPCLIHDGLFRDTMLTAFLEHLESGADGFVVTGDEYYFEPHNLLHIRANDPCHEIFKRETGFDVPGEDADDLRYRKWVLFNYEGTEDVWAFLARKLREKKPEVLVKSLPSNIPFTQNNRYPFALAYDRFAHRAELDYLETDYYFGADGDHWMQPYIIKRMMGASKNRRVVFTQLAAPIQREKIPFYAPIRFTGAALSAVMHGGRGLHVYRMGYPENAFTQPLVRDAFEIYRMLERRGSLKAKVPGDILVLASRASEDWWQIKSEMSPGGWKPRERWELLWELKGRDTQYAKSIEDVRGYLCHKGLMFFLLAEGYPFELYNADCPEDLDRPLAEAKLIVLPFAYSLPRATAEKILAAYGRGAKILIGERWGETDEFGEPLAKPALAALKGASRVLSLGESQMWAVGQDAKVRAEWRGKIDALLGRDKPLHLNRYERDVEIGLLSKGAREKFLFVVNWERDAVDVDVGVALPEGGYTVTRLEAVGERRVAVGGRSTPAAETLSEFRLHLLPNGFRVFHIQPAK